MLVAFQQRNFVDDFACFGTVVLAHIAIDGASGHGPTTLPKDGKSAKIRSTPISTGSCDPGPKPVIRTISWASIVNRNNNNKCRRIVSNRRL